MNKAGDSHQEYAGYSNIPLVGGIVIFLSIFLLSFYELNSIIWYFAAIFLIGFFSDLKKLNSPIIRFLLQLLVIIGCVYASNIILTITKIVFLDYFLSNYLFSIFFTSFCILIIINGSNFIDGVNSLAIGYYIIISLALVILQNNEFHVLFHFSISSLILCLSILYIFNLFNKLYLGDSGAYLLGFMFSVELINFYTENIVSPFFIILLLWYPAFENLFSILRKINLKKSAIKPDTNHLHQLIFSFFKSKNYSLIKANNITGISINIYNGFVVLLGVSNPSNTELQIILIVLSIVIYTFLYMRLYKYR
ncbi:undecaprenyl/decaprenyl-phosphate alpha-N-acetylglucosaminyl 1-phosphate transferase [Candidatus Pelagibacter sp.]|nr:undecaprenyl/decaprenyl-phosphate alpha-N-acetylglucosaminyl 1-phosphate transferase [Candidatus Pelagibacter sp.]